MKKTIAVIFGGRSAEHDISIITAHTPIIESLLANKDVDVWPIYITKQGDWYCDQGMNAMSFFRDPNYEAKLSKQKKVQLSFDNGLKIIWPGLVNKTLKVDLVFPATHGTYGEDGSLMGLLRMAKVPFVGCDLFASAVGMDKVLTKQVLMAEGVPVTPFVWFTRHDWQTKSKELKSRIQKLKWPVFVKPVHLGSSIAISKAKTPAELENAIEVALHYDDKVLVEESVEKLIEVTLPIIGNDTLTFGSIERPLNQTEFFNFEDKYLHGGGKKSSAMHSYSEIPAKIDSKLAKQVLEYGEKTYRTLGCSGIARVDFLIDDSTQKLYVNEVNLLPGSLYAHNWKKSGLSSMELVTTLVQLAEERFAAQQQNTLTFASSVLQNGGGKGA